MSVFNTIQFSNDTITKTASGALLISNPNILFDGKTLDADDTTLLWQNVGTGTFSWANNMMDMSVTSGQYCIRESRRRMPYFSGYVQIIEETFDNFNIEANVVKRVGYFSSSAIAPHTANKDGFWLEMDGTTYYLKASNLGTETVSVVFSDWDNYALLSSYNFDNFTAIFYDFLWLGGAALRIWICTPDRGWVLGHSATFIGNNKGTICSSPNQPVRYEIISSTGTGDFREICNQVSTGGSLSSTGFVLPSINTTAIACNSIGTIYALQGFKKNATYRDIAVEIDSVGVVNGATGDTGMLLFLRNPTLSAPLTYAAYGKIDRAIATTQTVSAVGEIIIAVPAGEATFHQETSKYSLWFTQTITNTFDEYVLAYLSCSANQDNRGIVNLNIF